MTPETKPSAAALRAAESLGVAGKLHRWPESQDKIEEAASIIDLSFAELRMEAENMALSLESLGYGDGGKLCTPLGRYRDEHPKP